MGRSEIWISFVDLLIISSIVLCLIISVSRYSNSRIGIDLPRIEERKHAGLSQLQAISIPMKKAGGTKQYYLGEKLLGKEELHLRLKAISPKSVMLRADKDIAYEEILDLIFLLREAGVKGLSFGYIREHKS